MKKTERPILIGSDPELFLVNAQGEYISAIEKVPGTKDMPFKLPKVGRGFAIQVDNVMVEYNTPPAHSVDTWCNAHEKMFAYITDFVGRLGLRPAIVASAELSATELAHPAANVFGCDPDFDAWNLEMNARPESNNKALRSAGGHIHIGAPMSDIEKLNIVRYLDMTIDAYSIIHDPDVRRAELYGRAGAMRFKPYGLEYRTVSNFWLTSQEHKRSVFLLARRAVSRGIDFSWQDNKKKVLAMFRNRDKEIAQEYLMKHCESFA
jgi:hypothetical protein